MTPSKEKLAKWTVRKHRTKPPSFFTVLFICCCIWLRVFFSNFIGVCIQINAKKQTKRNEIKTINAGLIIHINSFTRKFVRFGCLFACARVRARWVLMDCVCANIFRPPSPPPLPLPSLTVCVEHVPNTKYQPMCCRQFIQIRAYYAYEAACGCSFNCVTFVRFIWIPIHLNLEMTERWYFFSLQSSGFGVAVALLFWICAVIRACIQ